ncbi:F-box domain-containing protein [Mycena chlorophos]|uniref:F-box domain-containing protein n=1 Tax=Mycena chlorophos TaxID=658473 RepID=A0A8H6S8N7_MYCCL|nr:F-box domain-containing protein [Mycena chlorophos]
MDSSTGENILSAPFTRTGNTMQLLEILVIFGAVLLLYILFVVLLLLISKLRDQMQFKHESAEYMSFIEEDSLEESGSPLRLEVDEAFMSTDVTIEVLVRYPPADPTQLGAPLEVSTRRATEKF